MGVQIPTGGEIFERNMSPAPLARLTDPVLVPPPSYTIARMQQQQLPSARGGECIRRATGVWGRVAAMLPLVDRLATLVVFWQLVDEERARRGQCKELAAAERRGDVLAAEVDELRSQLDVLEIELRATDKQVADLTNENAALLADKVQLQDLHVRTAGFSSGEDIFIHFFKINNDKTHCCDNRDRPRKMQSK